MMTLPCVSQIDSQPDRTADWPIDIVLHDLKKSRPGTGVPLTAMTKSVQWMPALWAGEHSVTRRTTNGASVTWPLVCVELAQANSDRPAAIGCGLQHRRGGQKHDSEDEAARVLRTDRRGDPSASMALLLPDDRILSLR
jgi:hypothetical protein